MKKSLEIHHRGIINGNRLDAVIKRKRNQNLFLNSMLEKLYKL